MDPQAAQTHALAPDIVGLHTEARELMAGRLEKMNALLLREAEALVAESRDAIARARGRNEKVGGLALSIRYRRGQWGPRIVWVRVGRPVDPAASKRTATDGLVPRETRELPMPTGTWAHLNTFRRLPEPLATELRNIEIRARTLRQVVQRYRRMALDLNAQVDAEVVERSWKGRSSRDLGLDQ
jgi:hypothetical protein